MKNRKIKFLLVNFVFILFYLLNVSCTLDLLEPKEEETLSLEKAYTDKIIQTLGDASKYYVPVPTTTPAVSNNNTVLCLLQGGPISTLQTSSQIIRPHLTSLYNIAFIHQSQTLESNIFVNPNKLSTDEESLQAVLRSVAYAYYVIQHFKAQGKTVYVLSHSYGSFIYPKLIELYGQIAHKAVIAAGRLDMPLPIINAYRDGYPVGFEADATTFIISTLPVTKRPASDLSGLSITGALNAWRILSAVGQNRYTKTLSERDLSTLLYVTGTMDRAVGRLLPHEISFLRSKGATVIELNESHDLDSVFTGDVLPNFFR